MFTCDVLLVLSNIYMCYFWRLFVIYDVGIITELVIAFLT